MLIAMATEPRTLAAQALAERARGITSLDRFGSTARGEAGPKSDLDLLIEVDPEAGSGLSDLLDLQEELPGPAWCRCRTRS